MSVVDGVRGRSTRDGMRQPLMETRNLKAGYLGREVVRAVNLTVAAGEVVCLLGANGAGKTTTLLTIAGALPRLGGSLQVLGGPVTRARPFTVARRGVSMVPEGRGLFYKLTVAQNLRLRQHRRSSVRMADVLEQFPALR